MTDGKKIAVSSTNLCNSTGGPILLKLLFKDAYVNTFSAYPAARNTKILFTYYVFKFTNETLVPSHTLTKICWDGDPVLMEGWAVFAVSTSASTTSLATSAHSLTCTLSLPRSDRTLHLLYLILQFFIIVSFSYTPLFYFKFILTLSPFSLHKLNFNHSLSFFHNVHFLNFVVFLF